MDKILMGHFDCMAINQTILIPEGKEIIIPTDTFAESLVTICNNQKIFKVHLFGNTTYLEGIVELIERKQKELFNKNNIEIEVN